jgi:hypothetical protein
LFIPLSKPTKMFIKSTVMMPKLIYYYGKLVTAIHAFLIPETMRAKVKSLAEEFLVIHASLINLFNHIINC